MNNPTRPVVFTDRDIHDRLGAGDALSWAQEALTRHGSGALSAPPRAHIALGEGQIVVTAGQSGHDWYGYRCYDTMPTTQDEQIVVAHDATTGEIVAVAMGTELGARRTGALGGVAARALTGGTVNHLGIIGTGRQAFTQLWAIAGFARPDRITVHSRNPARRKEFSDRAAAELGLTVDPCDQARDAVTDADMVVLATSSPTPVIDTSWLRPNVVVTTMGPKQVGRAEFPPDLVTGAVFAVTDSIDQLRSYDPPALTAAMSGMHELAHLVTGTVKAPTAGRRIYCSVGLAGSEVHLLGRLAERARSPHATDSS